MNLLIDDIDYIVQSKIKIPFNTDFRQCILFELLMQDNSIRNEIKVKETLNLFYPDQTLITNIQKAIDDILWFYKLDKKENVDKKSNKKEEKEIKQIYSYEFDNELIYDAYIDQYKINLQRIPYLHWWEFRTMFEGLKEDNKIVQIMGYRAMDISKIKDKEEKKYYKQLQKQYALPDMRTTEQKEADFGKAFW